jgi:hypothetical protein
MDKPEKNVDSNVTELRPNTHITSDRNKELIAHFVQMLGEDTAAGIIVDSVQFTFIGTRKDQHGEYDSFVNHYWIDAARTPAKELSYVISLLQSEVQKRISASQDDKE